MQRLIEDHYGFKITELKPHGPVWKISSKSGYFALKRMNCDPIKIKWLSKYLNAFRQLGLHETNLEHHIAVAPIIPTKDKRSFLVFEKKNFILTPWYFGKNSDFNSVKHLQKIALLYGKLHQKSKLIKQSNLDTKQSGNPVDQVLLEKLNYLKQIQNHLLKDRSKNLNRIDRTILKWSYYFLTQAETIWKYVQHNVDQAWYHQTFQQGFCHKDPAPGNIINYKNKWVLIDFELSSEDFFINEVTTLMRRALELNNWNPQIFELILDSYQAERKLETAEVKLLIAMLCFPHPFWRICNQRFSEGLRLTEKHFQSKLWKITNSQIVQQSFIKECFPQITITSWEDQDE